MNFEIPEVKIGYETQSVNDGSSEFVNLKRNINGFNVNFGYKNTEFGNYDIPNGAILHEEEHEEGHEDGMKSMKKTLGILIILILQLKQQNLEFQR